jgi:hypothetical protein
MSKSHEIGWQVVLTLSASSLLLYWLPLWRLCYIVGREGESKM